ncbi:LysR family transcriptional regulator [Noviherbaspirillum sp.]|uniref:LysR family transcriptional regulator n=1 Tax=Noviherbaspirillum sp. TaxID=1926288 RepID=UPI002FE14FE5
MIHLDRIVTFLAVAAHGGFREAAKHTGLSQPAVTQHIKRLEQALKIELIDRSNTGSTLTAAGRTFLPYAENLVHTWHRACGLFAKESIVVGASSNTGIYLLQPYLKAYRDTTQEKLDVVIGDNREIADKLQRCEIDVAVMEWWDDRPGFVAGIWRREELVLIVPPQHEWAALPGISPERLRGLSFLGGEPGTGTGRRLQQCLGDVAHTIGVAMQLGSTEAVKHAVHAGLGMSLVMASAVEKEHRDGWLHAIPIDGKPLHKEIFVMRRADGFSDAPAVRFVDFLRQAAGQESPAMLPPT